MRLIQLFIRDEDDVIATREENVDRIGRMVETDDGVGDVAYVLLFLAVCLLHKAGKVQSVLPFSGRMLGTGLFPRLCNGARKGLLDDMV
jgi:hypothetical protein